MSATIKQAMAQANLKDTQLDAILKQIDSKVTDLKSRITKLTAESGTADIAQVEKRVAESGLFMLCEQAQSRSQEVLNKGRQRGG